MKLLTILVVSLSIVTTSSDWSKSESKSNSESESSDTSNSNKSSWKKSSNPIPSPTKRPTARPTPWPTYYPSQRPTKRPTPSPTRWPTRRPTPAPSRWPTRRPTDRPTPWPTHRPTLTPSQRPTTPSPTEYIPTNDEFCGCYQLNSVCAPSVVYDQICYYYIIESISDEDYCDAITTLTLSTENDCGLSAADINGLIMDYAPGCYEVDPLNANGIKFTLGSTTSSGSSGSGSTSKGWWSSTDSDDDSNSGSSILIEENPIIYSICFREGAVAGFNENGQITYGTSNGLSYTCDTGDLPNFCL